MMTFRYDAVMRFRSRFVAACCLAALLLPSVGCVRRMLEVRSEPAGALVWLNDQEVGRTPLEVPFTWYGTYDVRLEKDGYEPLWTTGQAKMPWWEFPGPDLVAELIPGAESRVQWDYRLTPAAAADRVSRPALIERAQELREETRAYDPEVD